MRKINLLLLFLLAGTFAFAQDFQHFFKDATLRLDYNFAGNANHQTIAVDELCHIPRWYGKKQRLSELPVEGNGQITVRDHRTKAVLFRNSFSTLFQEWLTYDEAKTTSKSFENVFLVPFPKDTVDITVELFDNRRQTTASLTHTVVPTDILIRHIGEKHVTPYTTLQTAADTTRCIHIAYVAEGYTEAEMPAFINDCRTAMEALFAHEPFKSLRNRFNVVAVKSPSAESGTSNPGKGIWKNTALHSNFNTRYSLRTHYYIGEHRKLWRRRHIELVQPLHGAAPSFQTGGGARIRTLFCRAWRRVWLRRHTHVSERYRAVGTQLNHIGGPKVEVGRPYQARNACAHTATSRLGQAWCKPKELENRRIRAGRLHQARRLPCLSRLQNAHEPKSELLQGVPTCHYTND